MPALLSPRGQCSDLRSVMTYMRPARPTCSASSRRRGTWSSNMGCAIQPRLGAAMASLEQPRQVPDIPEQPPLPEPEPDIPDEPGDPMKSLGAAVCTLLH